MVRFRPVKARALNQQYFLVQQQILNELHVILDAKPLYINFRKAIKGTFGFYAGEARNAVQQFIGQIPLYPQSSSGNKIFVDALVAPQGGLYGVLGQSVAAKPHGSQHGQPFDIVLAPGFISA